MSLRKLDNSRARRDKEPVKRSLRSYKEIGLESALQVKTKKSLDSIQKTIKRFLFCRLYSRQRCQFSRPRRTPFPPPQSSNGEPYDTELWILRLFRAPGR